MKAPNQGLLVTLIAGQLIHLGCTSEMAFNSADYTGSGGANSLPNKNPPGAITTPAGSVTVPTGSITVPTGSVTVPSGSVTVPNQLRLNAKLEPLSSGAHFVCYNNDGKVKCWGSNGDGELGHGFSSPGMGESRLEMGSQLPYLNFGPGRSAVQLAGGHYTNCAVLDDGSLMCWGLNTVGYLGLGDTTRRYAPSKVDLGTGRKAVQVAAAAYNTCALLDNGQVKCWGSNSMGSLGRGDNRHMGWKPNEMGDNLAPIDLGTGRTAKKIAGHGDTKCAILDNDMVKCWGKNPGGVLGTGDTAHRGSKPGEMGDNLPTVDLGTGRKAIDIDVDAHACAILDNGSVKCWGFNWRLGSLGLGDAQNHGDNPGEMGDALPIVDLGRGRTAKKIIVGFYGN